MRSSVSWKQSKCALLQVRITSGRYEGALNAKNIFLFSTRLGFVLQSFPCLNSEDFAPSLAWKGQPKHLGRGITRMHISGTRGQKWHKWMVYDTTGLNEVPELYLGEQYCPKSKSLKAQRPMTGRIRRRSVCRVSHSRPDVGRVRRRQGKLLAMKTNKDTRKKEIQVNWRITEHMLL